MKGKYFRCGSGDHMVNKCRVAKDVKRVVGCFGEGRDVQRALYE